MTELASGLVPSLLVIAALLIARRMLGTRAVSRSTGRIRVVERSGVSKGAAVAVVEVDQRRFLVGATEHGVSLLSELSARPQQTVAPSDTATFAHPTGTFPAHPTGLMDEQAGSSAIERPGSGLVHRLQRMTVRTHLEEPLREFH